MLKKGCYTGADFACPFGSAPVSASYARRSSPQSGESSEHGQEALAWEAQGGETLLGSKMVSNYILQHSFFVVLLIIRHSLSSWITFVGLSYNWRAIEVRHYNYPRYVTSGNSFSPRDGVRNILKIIQDISNFDWPSIFQNIKNAAEGDNHCENPECGCGCLSTNDCYCGI